MFFNYDSFEIVAIGFIVAGLFIQTYYIPAATSTYNDSLINTFASATNSSVKPIS